MKEERFEKVVTWKKKPDTPGLVIPSVLIFYSLLQLYLLSKESSVIFIVMFYLALLLGCIFFSTRFLGEGRKVTYRRIK